LWKKATQNNQIYLRMKTKNHTLTVSIICLCLGIISLQMNAQDTITIPEEMILFHRSMQQNNNMQLDGFRTSSNTGSQKVHRDILMVGPFDHGVQYFHINTNIPFGSNFANNVAPQIHITGYMYGNLNRALKLTLGWYYWDGRFHWTQYRCDLGYHNPSRIRLGTYNDGGTTKVRIEIANDGIFWSSYLFSAQDHCEWSYPHYYENWTYHVGEMPVGTSNITTVSEYGHINIGRANSPATLTVAGLIIAREIKVDINAGADFVFESDYNLRSLEEVEQFIIENRHLPNIAPAVEMVQNGVNMGEFQIQLLQKIEELTLYVIEQDKRAKSLEQKIEALERQINEK
jgi:hypothetical protein